MTVRTFLALPAIAVCLLSAAEHGRPPEGFAAPRIIMFHGGVLSEPAFMTDWEGNLRFLSQTYRGTPVLEAALKDRPYAEVAFFWHGPTWEDYASDPDRLKTLDPVQSLETCPFDARACVGRYYPAQGATPPVLDFHNASDRAIAEIPRSAQVFLERAHVPLHAEIK